MDYYKESMKLHIENCGKVEMRSKVPLRNREDLSIAYTPGVAEPCRAIENEPDRVYQLTSKANTVAVVTDGSAVLGLGNIGASAAIPVMEGKCVLFKEFGKIDAVPICIQTQDNDEIIETVKNIAPVFGGINIEDVAAPRCFEIERRLKEMLDIPVFHDDQHGTAIVVAAAVINTSRLFEKAVSELKIVINGAGAAGTAIAELLMQIGVKDILVCDKEGIIRVSDERFTPEMQELAKLVNPNGFAGCLKDALVGGNVFIGVSAPGILTSEMVRSMDKDSAVFAMANPEPEIMPDIAKTAGARVVGTGRSDFSNQINNVLVFPGIFRGALDSRAEEITEEMKVAAAYGLANIISEDELEEDYIIPDAFDPRVCGAVADAVYSAAMEKRK